MTAGTRDGPPRGRGATGNPATTVTGLFNSTPNQSHTVTFYASTACDATGFGEGEQLLGAVNVTTDANGEFSVTWPEAGMYWLETATEDAKTSLPQAKQRRLSYVATLEVLPQ